MKGGLDGKYGKREQLGNKPSTREYALGKIHLLALSLFVILVVKGSLIHRERAPESR